MALISLLLSGVAMIPMRPVAALAGLVKSGYALLSNCALKLRLGGIYLLFGHQRPALFTLSVKMNYLPYLSGREGIEIGEIALVVREPHLAAKNICLHKEGLSILQLQRLCDSWHSLLSIHIGRRLIVYATL